MKFAVFLLAVMAFGAAHSASMKFDDKMMEFNNRMKQWGLLELMDRISDPKGYPEYSDNFVYDNSKFMKMDEDMTYFMNIWKQNATLPKGQYFSIFNRNMMRETKGLFKHFFFAKDWKTFGLMAQWARKNVNEGMFVYALTMAIMHREDTKYMTMPAMNEIFPEFFFNDKFIAHAKKFNMVSWNMEMKHTYEKNWGMFDSASKWYEMKWNLTEYKTFMPNNETESTMDVAQMDKFLKIFWMKADYTEDIKPMNEESKLTYLTEDSDWNMYWFYMNMEFPFFMKAEELGMQKERRGELWMFNIQQSLARYYMERLSQGMGKIREFSWYRPVKMGYNPQMSLANGLGFSVRENYWEVASTENYKMMNHIDDFERRIRDVVDRGFYAMADGTKIDMRKPEAIEMVGNMMQGNMDSMDRQFFGIWMMFAHLAVSEADMESHESGRKFMRTMPNVMLQFETMMRDPLFYMMYKRVAGIYYSFKFHLGPYTKDELKFDGVRVKDFEVSELKTFFSWSEADVTTLIKSTFMDPKSGSNTRLIARHLRLDHKPFNITLDVESDKEQKAIIRLFLGPKFDEFGREKNFNENRKDFMEMDQFEWELKSGENVIKRKSDDFIWTRKDFTTYSELYMKLMMFKTDIFKDMEVNRMCAFPDRLLLPRGWADGMPMKMFVMVSPTEVGMKEYSVEEHMMACGRDLDSRAYGFPLDREIMDEFEFSIPNMFMKDVMIFHSKKMM